MRAWTRYVWLMVLGCGMAVSQAQGAAPAQRVSETEAIRLLKREAERATTADEFSGAVLVARHGKVVFQQAYGWADRDQRIANTLQTKFRFGSLGKMFTGVAIMQLVQSGELQLDDTVGKHLTDYPNPAVARVTIHQLLTHTGGTGDFFGPEYLARRSQMRTHADYLALLGDRGTLFEPGSRHEYSNYGYLLLGRIIEVVSGQRYADYVREHVFLPAGMTSTGNTPEDQFEPDRAMGYTRQSQASQPQLIQLTPEGGMGEAGDPLQPLPPLPPRRVEPGDGMKAENAAWYSIADTLDYAGTAAGGGFSTVGDLLRFATALLNNQLLDDRHTQLLMTGKVDTGRPGLRYAYGLEDDTTGGVHRIGHGGGSPGQNAWLGIYPNSGYVIIGLSNVDPPAASTLTSFVGSRLPL